MTPYGVTGCICWRDDVGPGSDGRWMPHAGCRYHGAVATPRLDTGQYRVLPGGGLEGQPDTPAEPERAREYDGHRWNRWGEYEEPQATTEQKERGVLAAIRRGVRRLARRERPRS